MTRSPTPLVDLKEDRHLLLERYRGIMTDMLTEDHKSFGMLSVGWTVEQREKERENRES